MKKILLLSSVIITTMAMAGEIAPIQEITLPSGEKRIIYINGEDRGAIGKLVGEAVTAAGIAVVAVETAPIAAAHPIAAAASTASATHVAMEVGGKIGDKAGDYLYDKAKDVVNYVKDKIKGK